MIAQTAGNKIAMTNRILNTNNSMKITLDMIFTQEGDYVTAFCPALDVSGYGRSVKEAKKSLQIELKIFIEETVKRGTLEEYLLDKGWTLQRMPKPDYKPPVFKLSKHSDLIKASINVAQESVCLPV